MRFIVNGKFHDAIQDHCEELRDRRHKDDPTRATTRNVFVAVKKYPLRGGIMIKFLPNINDMPMLSFSS